MLTPYEIPLSAKGQRFSIALGGATYRLQAVWNAPANCWMLDVSDSADAPLLTSIPLVTGLNLLDQFAYAGIAGGLLATTSADPDAVPTKDNLGDAGKLFFVTGAP